MWKDFRRNTALKADTSKKYTVCRRICASFSLEILQAGAVMGLKIHAIKGYSHSFGITCDMSAVGLLESRE